MKSIYPTIRLMTPEETRTAQLINAGSVIELEGTTIPISAGRGDSVHTFIDSTVLYVLSINYRHEYISLEIFDYASGEEYENIFLQYGWEVAEYLGKRWMELPPITVINKLINFFLK